MVLELAILNVVPSRETDFERAFAEYLIPTIRARYARGTR